LEESLAMEERGESMKIFDVKHEKAPTFAQITLQLCNNKDDINASIDIVDWIADGIKAENDQYVFILKSHFFFC
jgi:hypothetical protein